MNSVARAMCVLAGALLLATCTLTAGKITTDLTLRQDGRFDFAYKGEVILVDPSNSLDGMAVAGGETAPTPEQKAEADKKAAEKEGKYKAIVAALAKEKGVRAVRHLGGGKFDIDYAISGTLDHTFIFPFNSDAEIAIPFLMIEPRADNTARVRAVGFVGSTGGMSPMGPGGPSPNNAQVDGLFTVRTDAEVLSGNDEDGPRKADGMAVYEWKVDPLRKDAPVLTVRLKR